MDVSNDPIKDSECLAWLVPLAGDDLIDGVPEKEATFQMRGIRSIELFAFEQLHLLCGESCGEHVPDIGTEICDRRFAAGLGPAKILIQALRGDLVSFAIAFR